MFLLISSAKKLQCNIVAALLWQREMGRKGGREEGKRGMERGCGGIHAQGLATICQAGKGDGRLVRLVTAGHKT